MTEGPLIFVIAGENSGDLLGGRLMAALRRLTDGQVRVAGIGGPAMVAAGMDSLFPMTDLAVMGLAEVLPRLRLLMRRIDQTVAEIQRLRPAVVVGIDAPDFCFRVARRVKRFDPAIPVVHYVAPQVWAWRPGRAKTLAGFLDHILALLPFEPPIFSAVGLPCSFVGHSVVESGAGGGDGARFRNAHGLTADQPLITVLPGSRRGEVRRLLPVFTDTIARLAALHPDLAVVVPTVAQVQATVSAAAATWPVRSIVVTAERDKFDGFAAARAALAASGTVALELALARVPMVIAYRVNPLTAALARRLIRVRYVNLINIMLDQPLVPELLQENCRPDRLAAAVDQLLCDPEARQRQLDGAAQIATWLGVGAAPPSLRAARVVLDCIAGAGTAAPALTAAGATV